MNELKVIADLSIPLRFNGPQPNFFGADHATAKALGDTRAGSSVNYDEYTLTPHCNGTHTECVGHITDERISIRDSLRDVLMHATLISVEPDVLNGGEAVISEEVLIRAGLDRSPAGEATALIVRTLPNDESKLSRKYETSAAPPSFTREAIRLIITYGYTHILTDLPSIDRLDDPELANHRIFWGVLPGQRTIHTDSRIYSTITEMVFVPNEVADGEYFLNLQIAPFESDASPSRPILLSRD